MEDSVIFLRNILMEIKKHDALHARTIKTFMPQGDYFNKLRELIYTYFKGVKTDAATVANDYLHMVRDMRKETAYFDLHGEYSCKSQKEVYERVYSKPDVMGYYINALLLSQLLWGHHFRMLQYFNEKIKLMWGEDSALKVLDIGSGHGLFSRIIKDEFPHFDTLDVIDISQTSLDMSCENIGDDLRVNSFCVDFYDFNAKENYDFIILGEILEHTDNPLLMLSRAETLLAHNGIIWVTIPTNAPAIDHIYLFKSKNEVIKLINNAGLDVIAHFDCQVNHLTHLIGAFCEKK